MKKKNIALAVSLFMSMPLLVQAGVSGYLKNETSFFTSSGSKTGQNTTSLGKDEHDAGDLMKFENSARIFINGEFGEESSWHADLNVIYDGEGINEDYQGHKAYSQHDWLRELYVDTMIGENLSLRLGKQQVVWGTADGIKLLDIINPTDFRELNQNVMEDSRIPVWMVNAETYIGDSGSLQFIVSQVEENKIAGLNKDGDNGHAFLMKGVDSISGDVNGFLNIIPNLTGVATSFTMGAANSMFGDSDVMGDGFPDGLVPFANMSVDMFASMPWMMNQQKMMQPAGMPVAAGSSDNVQNFPNFSGNGFVLLNAIAQQGLPTLMQMPMQDPYGNHSVTNLMNEKGSDWDMSAPTDTTVSWDVRNPKSSFEYMPNASFATFNNSAGNQWLGQMIITPESMGGMGMSIGEGMLAGYDEQTYWSNFHAPAQSAYVRDYPEDEANFGMRFKGNTGGGLNYSLNYFYGYSSNPSVSLACRDSLTGQSLQHELRQPAYWMGRGANGMPDPATMIAGEPSQEQMAMGYAPVIPNYSDPYVNVINNEQVRNYYDGTIGVAYTEDENGGRKYYGAFNPTTGGLAAFGDSTHSPNGITMVFTETLKRANNIGTSFDYAFDTEMAPIVLRGEFLYTKDEMAPVVDKRLLGIGYLPEALTSEEHDMFKYVLGVDVNVLTNMMVSAQFIQFRNLDFQHDKRTCYTQTGTAFDCSRYTADPATMHMSNGLNKGIKNKEFYSLFFSKPFGESQEHRWNNITILEEGGGYWNRFDIEYSFNDTLLGTFQLNQYWGDEDTTFGQFEKSSNVQVGLKWIIE